MTQADREVAAAQQRADRVAEQYLKALTRSNQLDAQINQIERGVARLQERVKLLKKIVKERAVEAYERVGTSVDSAFADSETAMEAARRAEFLDLLNARDVDAAAALGNARDDLGRERRDLTTAKQEQAHTIATLDGEVQRLNGELVVAQGKRRAAAEEQARRLTAALSAATPTARAPSNHNSTTPAPSQDYSPRPGENPHHNDPFLVCTRSIESSGNYQAYNPSGPYYGAYQFLQSTWNATANHAGRGDLVGLDPRRASEYDQDDMAWDLYQWQGKGPWNGRC